MQHYTLTDARNHHSKVFDKATIEPVLLTNRYIPSHVLMSAKAYQQLIERLQELEEEVLYKLAEAALSQPQMAGVETFTSTLKSLADGEA